MSPTTSSPKSKPLRLTERDYQILEAIYYCRMLMTPQISGRFFPPKKNPDEVDMNSHKSTSSRCRERLRKLVAHNYLATRKAPTDVAGKPHLYFLDAAAIPILAERLGVKPNDIKWQPRDNEIKQHVIPHLIATNNFRLAVGIAVNQKELFKMIRWDDERVMRRPSRPKKVIVTISDEEVKRTLIPDGYFHLYANGYSYHHFIEIDMGTETVDSENNYANIIVNKLKMYQAYYTSGQYQADYGTDVMRVLIITSSSKRMKNMLLSAQRLRVGPQFWFATMPQTNPKTVLTTPIWRIPTSEKRFPLVGDLRTVS